MGVKITKDLSVWNKLKKNFIASEKIEGQLGWFEENRYGPDRQNLQMAQVAAWNEEGTEKIPERPVMRVGLLDAFLAGANKNAFKAMVKDVAEGKTPMRAFNLHDENFKITLREAMRDWKTPGNAALTIELKGFDDPWIETSELMANVNFKVSSDA